MCLLGWLGGDGAKGAVERIWLGNWSITRVCQGMAYIHIFFYRMHPHETPVQYWSHLPWSLHFGGLTWGFSMLGGWECWMGDGPPAVFSMRPGVTQEYYGEAGTLTFTTPEPMADAGTIRHCERYDSLQCPTLSPILPLGLADPYLTQLRPMAQSVFSMCPATPFPRFPAMGGLYFTSLVGGSTEPVIISFSPTRGDGYGLIWAGWMRGGQLENPVAVPSVFFLGGKLFLWEGFITFATGPWSSLVSVLFFSIFFPKQVLDYLIPFAYLDAKISWLGALGVLILPLGSKARQTTRDLDRKVMGQVSRNPSSVRNIWGMMKMYMIIWGFQINHQWTIWINRISLDNTHVLDH